jgi:hypothetical protein
MRSYLTDAQESELVEGVMVASAAAATNTIQADLAAAAVHAPAVASVEAAVQARTPLHAQVAGTQATAAVPGPVASAAAAVAAAAAAAVLRIQSTILDYAEPALVDQGVPGVSEGAKARKELKAIWKVAAAIPATPAVARAWAVLSLHGAARV